MTVHPPRRLFIALFPDRLSQAAIQRHAKHWHWPDEARATRFGRYHLALHFLGDVGLAPENRLRAALRELDFAPLTLVLSQAMLTEQGSAMLVPEPHEGLAALRHSMLPAIRAAGLFSPPTFTPHVTLARDAFNATPPQHSEPIVWTATEFVLAWSRLYPEVKPSRYEVVERFAARRASGSHAGEQTPLFG